MARTGRIRTWARAGYDRWEGRVLVALTVAAVGAPASMAWSTVRDVAAEHGQHGWRAVAVAVALEWGLLGTALHLRWCQQHQRRTIWAWTFLAALTVASLSVQLVHAEPSILGWGLAAGPPAVGLVLLHFVLIRVSVAAAATRAVLDSRPVAVPASVDVDSLEALPGEVDTRPDSPASTEVPVPPTVDDPEPLSVDTAHVDSPDPDSDRSEPVADSPVDTDVDDRVTAVRRALIADPSLTGTALAKAAGGLPRTTANRIREQLVAAGQVAA